MNTNKPFVLSIAGYDPSGGAGVLADIKSFEQLGVYGLAVATSITYQNDKKFFGVHWLSYSKIKKQLEPLLKAYTIQIVKIGLIENIQVLKKVIKLLKKYNSEIVIIWDPILKASAGFDFHKDISQKLLKTIFISVSMITPNWKEIRPLSGEKDEIKGAEKIATCCNIYLKGGHNIETPATDMIWIDKQLDILHPEGVTDLEKHGTGCVLSSAIAAHLARGETLYNSCLKAKSYTYQFLISNRTNLGYHAIV